MATTGDALTFKEFKEAFMRIQHRGPDMTRYVMVEDGMLGFHRLGIMGPEPVGMQPMHDQQNQCICNGEIYNYKKWREELSSTHSFQSKSDCEILLPMYARYQEDMFSMLDGEFAMVIYLAREKTWIAARDPMGIRPLFYGYQKKNGRIAFASEMKAMHDICEDIQPFPIGCYYKDEQFIRYHDCTSVSIVHRVAEEQICAGIRSRLEAAIMKRLDSDVPIGFLLSGGLDSSLVCAIAAKHTKQPLETFAIGMKKDAIDLAYAKQVAHFIGSNHHEVIIDTKDVLSCIKEVIYHLETFDITTIRASIGMYLLCKYIRQKTDIRVIMSGEISDELFGYKYTDYAPTPLAFQEESIKRIKELYMYDVLRADRCMAAHGLEARVPFSDKELIHYVMSIDPALKMNTHGIGKYLLRAAFSDEDLPASIRWREKAAFSDAVGHSLVDDIKAYAESYYDDATWRSKCDTYTHAQPFTKESLLYREIFEQQFPKRSSLIKDFWMPNRTWEHCDVQDPSARVLKNYGKSGQ